MLQPDDSTANTGWGPTGETGRLPLTRENLEHPAGPPGKVRCRIHRGYWAVLILAWLTYLISMGLDAIGVNSKPDPGIIALIWAAEFCVVPFDPLINLGAWIGTLCNIVMLFLSPIWNAGGKGRKSERFFDIVALISGLWVWTLLLIFGPDFFYLGYYVWGLTHLAVGTRIFWPHVYYDNWGVLPPGQKQRDPSAYAIPAPTPADDWPKDQAGQWDEARPQK